MGGAERDDERKDTGARARARRGALAILEQSPGGRLTIRSSTALWSQAPLLRLTRSELSISNVRPGRGCG
jgi:hypothetical protein